MAESPASRSLKVSSLSRAHRSPALIFTAHVALLVVALPGLSRLETSADTRVFFGDNAYHQDLKTFEKRFNQSNSILLLLRWPGHNITSSPAFADTLRAVTDEAWTLPYVLRVDSLANYPHVSSTDDAFSLEPLLDVLCPDECLEERADLLDDPMLVARLVSADGTTLGVHLVFDLPFASPTAVQRITDSVRQLARRLEAEHAGLQARYVGAVTMMAAFNEAAERDTGTLVPLVLGVMLLMLIITLGEARLALLLVGAGLYAGLCCMGLAGWLGVQLNAATSIVPVVIITLVVASGLHLMSSFLRQFQERNAGARDAAAMALELNVRPILLTSGTTMIGFLSMNFADSPPLRELGNLVTAGVLVGTSVLLLPMPLILGRFRRLRLLNTTRWIDSLLRGVVADRRGLRWGAVLLVIVSLSGLQRIEINDDFVRYFDESFEFRRAAEFAQKHMSGPNGLDLSVGAAEPGGIYDPDYLVLVRDLGIWLRQEPLVANVVSLADIVWKIADQFGAADVALLGRDEIAQYVLTYELSLTAGQELEDFLDKARATTRVSILLSGGDSKSVIALEQRIYAWFEAHAPPAFELTVTGINVPVAHMSLLNIRSMLVGILLSLVLIAAIVGGYFRSFRVLLITAPAIFLPIAMGFGLWGWFVANIGLAASVIAAVTIGIVVDDAIHIIYRYQHTRRTLGVAPREAARVTVLTVGNAVLITSLALALGFAFLALSGFEINRSLGLCTMLIVLCGLIVDLVLLPPVMTWLDGDVVGDS